MEIYTVYCSKCKQNYELATRENPGKVRVCNECDPMTFYTTYTPNYVSEAKKIVQDKTGEDYGNRVEYLKQKELRENKRTATYERSRKASFMSQKGEWVKRGRNTKELSLIK